jgi:ABC-type multidrug transport system ATPase subunit
MFELFEKVSKARVKLFRDSELKRALLIGAPRIVPQFVFMWLIYVLAISENRSVPELAMLSGFVTTTMMVSYTGFQLLLNIAESQGDIDHLDELMSSSDIENNRPRGDRPQGEHVIDRVETLSIQTDLRVTLPNGDTLFPDGLFPHHPQKKELLIQKGDCIVCVGTKGSGKSTLADILGRYSENLSTDRIQWTGKYQVNCHDVFETDLESFYLRVFYGTQTANHVDGMREDEENKTLPGTVRDNISLFLLRPELRLHLTPEEKEMWIKRAAAVVKLDKKLDQEVSTLSGGERALCMIGRGVLQMILGELDILILDEPFAHIDVATGKEMSEILSYLAKSYNCALLMINHVDTLNPPEATAYVFGESGKGIVEIGRVDVLRQSADSLYVHTLFEKTAQNTVIPQHRWDEIVAKTKIR